jgi:hypothetical protein
MEPWASLTLSPASGRVFGVTTLGGPAFGGVIFRLESGTGEPLVLNIQKIGSTLELTWLGSAAGLQPQFNTDLSNRNGWQGAPGTPTLVNGSYKLSIVPSSSAAFYRLAKP